MQIDDLIVKTRELVGDVEHEGNTTLFSNDQLEWALNMAQNRAAEATHATYIEVDTTVDESGFIDLENPTPISENGIMRIDRVRVDDDSITWDPVADITADATVDFEDIPFTASVTEQTSAVYRWTVAGGTFSGQGTEEIQVSVADVGKVFIRCDVTLHNKTVSGTKTVTVE